MKIIRVLVYEGDARKISHTLLQRSAVIGSHTTPEMSIKELFVDPRRIEEEIQCCDIHDRCVSREEFFHLVNAKDERFNLEQDGASS